MAGASRYEVSDQGRVRQASDGKIIAKPAPATARPRRVAIRYDVGKNRNVYVYRLVVGAFLEREPTARSYTRYDFIDGNKNNSAVSNLRPRRSPHCLGCGVLLTEKSTYRKADGELYARCRRCLEVQRRKRMDRIQDERRKDMPLTCEICEKEETVTRGGRIRRLTIDHNHETGQIRGVLCARCNTAIGLVFENPETLRAAADYIERYNALAA